MALQRLQARTPITFHGRFHNHPLWRFPFPLMSRYAGNWAEHER